MSSAMPVPGALTRVTLPAQIGGHQPGHAEQRIRAEDERVEEGVVDPAVDDVDPHRGRRSSHPDDVVVDLEVAALDQLDPHIVGEEAVLVKGRVVVAGGQQDAARLARAAGRDRIAASRAAARDRNRPARTGKMSNNSGQRRSIASRFSIM